MSSTIRVPVALGEVLGHGSRAPAPMGVSAAWSTLSRSTRPVTALRIERAERHHQPGAARFGSLPRTRTATGAPGGQLVGDQVLEHLLGDVDAALATELVEHAAGGVEDDLHGDVLARRGLGRRAQLDRPRPRTGCPAAVAASSSSDVVASRV